MSEYWKSTPKYWCKHCKTYVRDTKLEKANHDATPKHQGNLKRFLRDLHRGHEKDEKDKERAKSEVARLNGLVTGGGSNGEGSSSSSGFGRGPTPSIPKPQATAAQRKQQVAQLAEMGIEIPDEFRGDMALPGQWHVTEERILGPNGETKPDALALGVRKRQAEEEEEEAVEAKKRRWGSAIKSHPVEEDDGDLDALLSNVTRKGKEPALKVQFKQEAISEITYDPEPITKAEDLSPIKKEGAEGEIQLTAGDLPLDTSVKQEGEEAELGSGVIFKKRKAKNIRQK